METSLPLYLRYPLDKRLGGPQNRITLISKIAQGAYKKKATRFKHRTQNNTLDLTKALASEQLLNSLVDSESLRAAAKGNKNYVKTNK
jgi:hypothetical protein